MITDSMNLLAWLREQLAEADSDLLREMVRSFAEALMGAAADAVYHSTRKMHRRGSRSGSAYSELR